MAKVTLSVPDDLYEKLEKHKDRLNYSDIFRRAVSEEIERIEEKGELIKGLIDYLSGKLPRTEDKEKVRKEEIERFTRKWGTPDHQGNDEEASHNYVTLLKKQKISLGDRTLAELEISNSRSLTYLQERLEKGFGKYDINLYDKNLEPLIEYFKSKDFTIEERNLLQNEVMHYVLKTYGSQGREQWRQLASKGYEYYGLFAADKEDNVFITYREVKPQ